MLKLNYFETRLISPIALLLSLWIALIDVWD